jgi:predicted kinase
MAKHSNPSEIDSTLSDAPRPAQAHLILGPVGAGKSTYALALLRDRGAVRFALDDWMTGLFSSDRPDTGVTQWYAERAKRCVDRIWSVATSVLGLGKDVVLELGLVRRAERAEFLARVDATGFALVIHLLDAARDVRRERVLRRNRQRGETFSMVVPPAIFELASDLWEPPSDAELAGRDVRRVRTDRR